MTVPPSAHPATTGVPINTADTERSVAPIGNATRKNEARSRLIVAPCCAWGICMTLITRYRAAGVPGGLCTPGRASGFATQTSHSSPSGSRKNTLRIGPKSVTNASAAPRAMSRSRMVSNASIEAAWSARWSSRPRPNIGVCRCASVLPAISNTFSSAVGPTWITVILTSGLSSTSGPSRSTSASKTSV